MPYFVEGFKLLLSKKPGLKLQVPVKTATTGQHATLAIHSMKENQSKQPDDAGNEHGLSSRSLLKVKEAVEDLGTEQ